MMYAASAVLGGRSRAIAWPSALRRSLPSISSIAMNSSPSALPKSNTCTMLRCVSSTAMRASSMKLRMNRPSRAECGRIRLSACTFSNPAIPTVLTL